MIFRQCPFQRQKRWADAHVGYVADNTKVIHLERKSFEILIYARIVRTPSEYLDSRIEDKQIRGGTKRHYITLSKFLRGWNKIVTFSDITESNIRNMDEYLKKSGKMQSTVSKYHSLLKAIINDAVVDGYLDYNPYVSKRIRIDRGEKEYVVCNIAVGRV